MATKRLRERRTLIWGAQKLGLPSILFTLQSKPGSDFPKDPWPPALAQGVVRVREAAEEVAPPAAILWSRDP